MDIGITKLSDYYDKYSAATSSTTIIFCPHCGAENYIAARGNTIGLIYCVKCGELIC